MGTTLPRRAKGLKSPSYAREGLLHVSLNCDPVKWHWAYDDLEQFGTVDKYSGLPPLRRVCQGRARDTGKRKSRRFADTTSIAFRHLLPKEGRRKPVLGACGLPSLSPLACNIILCVTSYYDYYQPRPYPAARAVLWPVAQCFVTLPTSVQQPPVCNRRFSPSEGKDFEVTAWLSAMPHPTTHWAERCGRWPSVAGQHGDRW